MWLAATNGNSKQKKGEASCTCRDPRGSSSMVKQGAADASQKPIDPSSLSITEALAGTFVATVFEFVQLNTVTPKVLNDARTLMHQRLGIPQIEGTNRNDPPAPELVHCVAGKRPLIPALRGDNSQAQSQLQLR